MRLTMHSVAWCVATAMLLSCGAATLAQEKEPPKPGVDKTAGEPADRMLRKAK
jgi:hypothetical protein